MELQVRFVCLKVHEPSEGRKREIIYKSHVVREQGGMASTDRLFQILGRNSFL